MFIKNKKSNFGVSHSSDSGKWKEFFNLDGTGLKLYKLKEGKNVFDIVPYNASENHFFVKTGRVDVGDVLFNVDVYIHALQTGNIVCRRQYDEICPHCEEIKNSQEKKWAKRRNLYIVRYKGDNGEYQFGLLNMAFKGFGDKLINEIQDYVSENKNHPMDWENGCSVVVRGVKDTWEGKDFIKADKIDFIPRQDKFDSQCEKYSMDLTEFFNSENPKEEKKVDVEESKMQNPKEEKQTNDNGCPFGHRLGEADEHDECTTCDKWKVCISSF